MGGGTNTSMIRMDIIDIFDISTQTWTKQYTKGPLPSSRLSPCAVVASAQNTVQIYMYGGQSIFNDVPFDDIWILSLPTFTWIQVPSPLNNPPGRTGHTCHAIGSEMLVLGGWTADDVCEVADIHVFNMSSLRWGTTFDPNSLYSVPEIVVSANKNDITIEPVGPAVVSTSKTLESHSASTSFRQTSTSRASTLVSISSFTSTSLSTIRVHTSSTIVSTEIVTITTVIATSTDIISLPPSDPATALPGAGRTSALSNTTLGAIVGGSLGGAIVLLILGFAFFMFRRRQPPGDFNPILQTMDSPPPSRAGYIANGGSVETINQMSEWDISEWEGDVLLSPRQSLRIVNE